MPISQLKIPPIPRYVVGARSLLLLQSHDLFGFRVTTKFASCFVVHILKGHMWGDISTMQGQTWLPPCPEGAENVP